MSSAHGQTLFYLNLPHATCTWLRSLPSLPVRSITIVTFERLRYHAAALLRSLVLTTCSRSLLANCANIMWDVPLGPRWHATPASATKVVTLMTYPQRKDNAILESPARTVRS